MKRLILSVILAALVAVPASSSSNQPRAFDSVRALAWTTQSMSYDQTSGSVVVTESVSNHCTATSINEKKHYWLTAAHCVSNEEMTGVMVHDYQIGTEALGYHQAILESVDLKDDLAILSTPDFSVRALRVSKRPVMAGDEISMVGHPFGWPDAVLFKGIVANPSTKFDPADKSYMVFQMAAAPGNSGSAVLNDHDEIVSVLQVGWGRSFGPVTGGAPFNILRAFVVNFIN